MGNDLEKGTIYATGGVGGQGSITSANLNAHVDDAVIKPTFITAKADRSPGVLTDQILLESGGALYKMLLSTLYSLLVQPGSIIQTVAAAPYVTNANITTVIPADDTPPQIGEGTQILSLSITPRSSVNKIRLQYNGIGSMSVVGAMISALFRSGNANAIKTTSVSVAGANFLMEGNLDYVDSPGVTTPQTYSIRVGPNVASTMRMNGNSGARVFGGSASCTLVAQEIKA